MTSLVTEFLVNPVIRHARQFSRSEDTTNQTQPAAPLSEQDPQRIQDDATSETDKESFHLGDDDIEGSASTTPSSRTSVQFLPHSDLPSHRDGCDSHSHHGPLPCPGSTQTRNHGLGSPELPSRAELPIRESVTRTQGMDEESIPLSRVGEGRDGVPQDAGPSFQREAQKPKPLPEDDGMGLLRRRILNIQSQDVPPSEKARLMHHLFLEGYAKSRSTIAQIDRPFTPSSPNASDASATWQQRLAQGPLESFRFWQNALLEEAATRTFNLTEEDVRPTFAPPVDLPEDAQGESDDTGGYRPFGCEHYRRNVKLQCSTCNRWYTCRFCHDQVEDHALIRKETRNMLCMLCGTAQRASEVCIACGVSAARYYCSICKLWNDDPDKNIYHCNDCGICRIGRGLGKDFFHCKKCCACIAISKETDHRCIERVTDCDCPICGDYMFTSPKAVCFMKCGHSIHRGCLDEFMQTSYKCPICNKSVTNMEFQFRNLDIAIQSQPMPPEFEDTKAVILCNDCSAKSSVKYHWLGLKCAICLSYNTAQLQILGTAPEADRVPVSQLSAQLQEAAITATPRVTFQQENPAGRDIPRRRRHSSDVLRPATTPAGDPDLSLQIPDRLSRSFSPMPNFGHAWSDATGQTQTEFIEEEEREDMLGFWSRLQRSIGSDEDGGEHADADAADSEDSEWSTEDEDMEDEDDDEEEDLKDFSLLGHR